MGFGHGTRLGAMKGFVDLGIHSLQQRQDRFLAGAERSQPHHERNSKQKQKQEPVGPNIHNNGPAAAVGVVVRREPVFVFFYFFLDCE